jgi:sirohydrochlorin cobaltochelatase
LRQGIVLVAHGSREPEWSRPFELIASRIAKKLPALSVALAYLEHGASLEESVAALAAKGVSSIRVVPLFLGQGGHVREDLPRLVSRAMRPGLDLQLETAIGERPEVLEAIVCAICEPRSADRASR